MRRGLVVIYDPHALMQFLQFYCMGDYEAEWDALCLPKEYGEEEMHPFCEKTGIFQKVYVGKVEYQSLPITVKLKMFIPMVAYSIIGQRRRCCAHILNEYVEDIKKYDILVANTELGFISGMLASFGKEKTVIYFEDGIGDYTLVRKRWKSFFPLWSFKNFQSVLMARLGYFGKGYTYLEPTKETIKYCSASKQLFYKNYKEIREFSLQANELEKFKELIGRVYPELRNIYVDEKTAVVFTSAVEGDYQFDFDEYINRFMEEIYKKHKRVLLKCHPRENVEKYAFPANVIVDIVPRNIPAELLMPYLNKNDCYFMMPDSIMLNMQSSDLKIHILRSDCMQEQIEKDNLCFSDTNKERDFCERFIKGHYDIIKI